MSHKQFYAALEAMMKWAQELPENCIIQDKDDLHYTVNVIGGNVQITRLTNPDVPFTVSSWSLEQFCKLALDRKFERLCMNCKRRRREHLKKTKCLFGATAWS